MESAVLLGRSLLIVGYRTTGRSGREGPGDEVTEKQEKARELLKRA